MGVAGRRPRGASRTSRRSTAQLDHYGAYAIAGPQELTITGAGVDGAGEALVWTPAQGYFAPAQYDDLSRAEKLAAPSYEEMTAGVRFGIDGIALPDADEVRSVTTSYERAVVDGAVRTGSTTARCSCR